MSNHLWQSTWLALAAGLMAWLLRHNRAGVRFWLWFCASLKFLVPLAFLVSLGALLPAPAGSAYNTSHAQNSRSVCTSRRDGDCAAGPQGGH